MFKKIFIIATEPSGDLIGHKILKVFKDKYPNIVFKGLGGEKMESESFKSDFPIKELSVNGIYEVLIRIFKLRKMFFSTLLSIRKFNPDLIITIDSPSFNYRIVNKLQKLRNQYKFVHFVAPTVWAWKKYRAKEFSLAYDMILTLFSFEPKYFLEYNKKTFFIGHPIFYEKKKRNFKKKNILSFFPGSRINEVKNILPKLLTIIDVISFKYKSFDFYIVTLPILEDYVKKFVKNKKIKIVSKANEKKKIMEDSKLSIVASGTVVLELAKTKTPMIVVYDSSFISAMIIKFLVNLKWANLINIIRNKEVIPEFLFNKFKIYKVISEISSILSNKNKIDLQLSEFKKIEKVMLNNMEDPSLVSLKLIEKLWNVKN